MFEVAPASSLYRKMVDSGKFVNQVCEIEYKVMCRNKNHAMRTYIRQFKCSWNCIHLTSSDHEHTMLVL